MPGETRQIDLERIKRLAIIAMFSDDDLLELLVLKGGNALDIVYDLGGRASLDLDFSVEKEFGELDVIERKVTKALEATFAPEGLRTFDVKVTKRPPVVTPDLEDFWGGYGIEFKVIEKEKYDELGTDIVRIRKYAAVVGTRQRRKFLIDISKYEYCQPKKEIELDGYTIYVYTPEMIVFEKLRAICQQMPEYRKAVKSLGGSARARDFFDIYSITHKYGIDFGDHLELVRKTFEAKRVPLGLIGEIESFREYHRPDFTSVEATVRPGVDLQPFDFYFDFVIEECKELKALWVI